MGGFWASGWRSRRGWACWRGWSRGSRRRGGRLPRVSGRCDAMKFLPFDYAVRNLGRSRLRLVLSVLGSALVVLLVLGAGGFVAGMTESLTHAGDERNVLVMGIGSE